MIILLLSLCAYLLGSVSSAIIVSRLLGMPDPRGVGSGNPGATNMLRVGGKTAAAITLGGDLLKGLLPVLLAQWLQLPLLAVVGVGLAAFLGHLYPVFFGLRGGKGVATLIGVLLGVDGLLGLAAVATWLAFAAVFRMASLASLVMAALAPLYGGLLRHDSGHGVELALVLFAMAALLFWRHRGNIRNMRAGREDKLADSDAAATPIKDKR